MVLVALAVAVGVLVSEKYAHVKELGGSVKLLEGRVTAYEDELEDRRAKAEYLSSDAYKERQARIKLNFKKPGEKVVYVYRTDAENSAQSKEGVVAGTVFDDQNKSSWQRWWEYAIGR